MKKIIISGLVLFGLIGCSNFLDEFPQTELVAPEETSVGLVSIFTALPEIEAFINGAYHNFKADIYQMQSVLIGDAMTDNCYVGGDGAPEAQYENIRISPTNTLVDMMWSQYFDLAVSATDIIENIKLLEDGVIDEADQPRVDQIMAEAKFIRAWAYFDMVRLWGEVPLVLELLPSVTADNLEELLPIIFPERVPVEDVYAQILKDLDEDEVIALLPKSSKGQFRATQGAAYGLLAKIYATMGAKEERNYTKVVEYCDKVIAEGYQLEEDFGTLWNPETNYSKESIFELDFTETNSNWAYWVFLTEKSGTIEVTWRRYCTLTHELYDKFDRANDVRFEESVVWAKVDYSTFWPAESYPLAYKIRQKGSQIILLRLGDILLLKAEALVELGQSGDAMDIVNDIRTRAGVAALSRTMSQGDARLAVEQERQFELLLEGHRWHDLVRNDRMEEVMNNHKDADGNVFLAKPVEEFRRLLPVPQNEIDLNSKLTQNEGYN